MSERSKDTICVVQVCPGEADDPKSMPFVRRQAESLRCEGVDVHEVFIEDRQSLTGLRDGVRAIRAAVREHSPNIVHAQYGTVTGLATLLAAPSRYMITFRGSDLNRDATSSPIKMSAKVFMSQLAALGARRIVTVSAQLQSRLWWRRKGVTVIPSGVNLERFRPMERSAARAHLGWHHDHPVILFNAARNAINKRLDLAEETLERVRREMPSTEMFVMRGDVEPGTVPYLMNACDVLLMLSDNEGSPNVVKEGMACNLPVVSFAVGDVESWLSELPQSRVVARDVGAVAQAALVILRSRQRCSGRARADAFSGAASARKLVQVYREVLA